MPGYARAFGRGFAIGAGAAFLYAAARETGVLRGAQQPVADGLEKSHLVDWSWAEQVAIRAAGVTPAIHPATRARLESLYQGLLTDIEEPIAHYTGNHLSLRQTRVEVLDRPGWIRANMVTFRQLLEPIEEFYRENALRRGRFSAPPAPVQEASRWLLGTQVGLLVGYLSRRVLGQYDLAMLGEVQEGPGSLYFVEPNLAELEHRLNVPGDELRRWVALHEATHAHEFEVYPWVRSHFRTSVRSYLRLMVEDMRRQDGQAMLVALAGRLIANLQNGQNLIQAFMTPEQRQLMSRLQALMSLAEGYSNHVMNAVGRSILPSFDLLHERVEQRQRQRSQAEMAFLKLTGLSMKMEQYRLGERFVNEVVRARGVAWANRAWESPENLPTEAEIAAPERWIDRMERKDS